MKIYNYHPTTGEYTGESLADESPLEPGIFLIPAYAANIEPPLAGMNKVVVFEGGHWVIKSDYRGKEYWRKQTKEKVTIDAIGVEPDREMTAIQPPLHECVWDNTKDGWIADIPILKARKKSEVKAEANRRILALVPAWKQRNLLARSLELTKKIVDGNALTEPEKLEISNSQALWDDIKTIRDASNVIEAEIDAITDSDALIGFDIVNNPLWPANT